MANENKEIGANQETFSGQDGGEIAKLKEELHKKEAELTRHKEEYHPQEKEKEKELSKEKIEKIKEKEKIPSPEKKKKLSSKILPKAKAKPKEEFDADLRSIMAMKKPKQVKALIYLSFKKGIYHAASIAEALNSPYLLDEFHDTLVNELYEQLIKKRKLKK